MPRTLTESIVIAADAHDEHYPRPRLVRENWRDLTGEWRFSFDDQEEGLADRWWDTDHHFAGTIIVPFPPESEASGIRADGIHDVVWYQRTLTADDMLAAGFDHDTAPRLLLHFGAVDYRCSVWLDGNLVGTHEGGHTPFSFDIADLVDNMLVDHTLTVRAEDRAADIGQPRGKQDWRPEPHVIWYRRTTGIWQPVWLEAVPSVSVEQLHWTVDVPAAKAVCEIRLRTLPVDPVDVGIVLGAHGTEIGRASTTLTGQRGTVTIDLPGQVNGQAYEELTWTPESPTLIDALVTVDTDSVASYLGLRTVGTAQGAFLLNDRPVYLRSVLSQGYWPTSHLAAPTPDALRAEVELILELGFNSARVHQKTEDPRFLYWADKLGLMLWAEAPAAFEFSSTALERTTHEWLEVLDRDRSHPSVVTWVPMNESWGIQHIAHDPRQAAFAQALTSLTRAVDPSRPVISNDGWEHVDSDILTIHDYDYDEEVLSERYAGGDLAARLLAKIGPAGRRLHVAGLVSTDAPVMVSEFGGINYSPGIAPDDAWGYSSASGSDDFADRLSAVYRGLQNGREVVGTCYTQLTDTLQEANGLATADRVPKLPAAVIRGIVEARR